MPHHKTDSERITALEEAIKKMPTQAEISLVVEATIIATISKYGRTTKTVIVTVAGLVAAIAIISGGLKWILALIGFHYVK